MSTSWRAVTICICVSIILVLSAFIAINSEPANREDPDRYYHYAVSKITSQEFAPETLPQIEGLGWDKFFQEKEFFFHVITGLGYKIAKDKGVLVTCMLIGAGIILSLYFVNMQVLSPFMALIPTLLIVFASTKFLVRAFSVRPHILAVFFAILLLGALIQKRPKLSALMSFLFALSYHAIYVPLILAGIACIASLAVERDFKTTLSKSSIKCLVYTMIGITIGILVNPYFPSNILMGIQHLKIAFLSAGLPISHFGAELASPTGSSLLVNLAGFLILLAFGLISLGYFSYPFLKAQKNLDQGKKEAYAAALTTFGCFALFVVLTFQSPRGNEYLVPFAAIFISRLVQITAHKTKMLIGLSLGLFLLQVPSSRLGSITLANGGDFFQTEVEPTLARLALEGIPKNTDRNRIFNCNWDVSPFILYNRPDLVFIDTLDPSFLFSRNPDFYLARDRWYNGEIADSFGLLKHTFNADYVFCRTIHVPNQLKSDPHFDILFPKNSKERRESEFTVLALKSERPLAFVKHFSYRDKLVAAESAPSTDGLKNWPGDISSDSVPPIFIDLRRLVSPDDVFTSQVVCNDIEPFGEEVARLTGSTIVGLGGGPHLQLWIDGKLVYTNVNFSAQRSILHSLVELDSPITSETQIRLRVCSPESSAYLAASLSLWTKKLLQETCSQRKGKDFDYVPKDNAQKTEKSSIECLAPIVGRQEPN